MVKSTKKGKKGKNNETKAVNENSIKQDISKTKSPEEFIKNQYSKCWNFIKDSRKQIYIILAIFAIFMLAGSFMPVPETLHTSILNYFNTVEKEIQDKSFVEMTGFLFSNNLQASFFGLIFGLFLGIVPLVISVSNGYIIGFVMGLAVRETSLLVLWRIIPHGIFELPAVFLSLGMGLKIGTFIFKKDRMDSLKTYLINSFRVFLLVVIPLLFIAAIIESWLISFI